MLKKITFCFLAALLICSFTIFAFAAEYTLTCTTRTVIDVQSGTLDSDLYGSNTPSYKFYLPVGSTVIDFNGNPLVDAYLLAKFNGLEFNWEVYGYLADGTLKNADGEWTLGKGEVSLVTDGSLAEGISIFAAATGITLDGPPVHYGLFETFSTVFSWIAGVLVTIVSLFWANGSLTFFGICAIVALGIGLFLLISHVISNFLQFRS